MVTITDSYLRKQLVERRGRLEGAVGNAMQNESFAALLQEVDVALERMDAGTYGICESCHESIEVEHLVEDPLSRFCIDHMTGEQRRALENDLELAAEVQRALLPARDVRHGVWHIYHHYQPAGAVSGDYCDIIPSEEGGPFFLLGDVSGKGIAASLLMSHLHAMFRTLAGKHFEIGRMMEMANRAFCTSAPSGHFATLVCGRPGDGGEIELISAGHLPALIARHDGVQPVWSNGVPLGMFCGSEYSSTRLHLRSGESLVLYTDGLSEARNHSADEYGLGRIQSVLGKNLGATPEAIAGAFLQDLGEFSSTSRLADDLTLMIVQHSG